MCAVLLCCVADAGLLGQHGRHKGTVILVLAIVAQNALCASKLGLVIQTYVIAIISYTDPSTCDWQQLNASHLATGGRVLPPGAVHTYKHLHPPPPHTPTNKRLHAHLPTGGRVLPPGAAQTQQCHLHWQRQSGRDPASRQGVQGGHGGCHDGWPTQWPT